MTFRKIAALLLASAVCVGFLAGCAPGKDAVVATVDGENIYKWELDIYYSQQAPYFESQNDIDLSSPKNRDKRTDYVQQLVEKLVGERACLQEARKLGLDQLSAEELADTDAQFKTLHDQNISEFVKEFASDKDPAARAEEKFQNMMKEKNLSEEKVKQNINDNKTLQKLFDQLATNQGISDEELRAKYEELLEGDKARYAETPELYGQQHTGIVCFIPPGYIRVKHILIGHSDEMLAKLQAEQQNLSQLSGLWFQYVLEDGEESPAAVKASATMAKAEEDLQKKLSTEFEKLLPRAEEVLAKAQAGEDFDALIEQYNTDPGMAQLPGRRDGYYMCEASDFAAEFKDAAFELKNVGDISPLVNSFYGYHVIKLLEKVESRVVPFEDVKEDIRFQLQGNSDIDEGMRITLRIVNEREVQYFPKNYF